MGEPTGILDDSLIGGRIILVGEEGQERRDGFAHQRLSIVPRPLVEVAVTRPVTRRMLVTDAGYFPRADHHSRRRPHGVEETIVIVCVAGEGWVEIDGSRSHVGPSTAIVIPARTAHAYGAGDVPWTIWWCHVRGADVPELVDECGVRSDRVAIPLRSAERVTALLDEISHALSRDTTPARLIATSGMAWRMFTQLAADRLLPLDGTPVERAMRYLEERVDGRVTVPELAAMVGLSTSHLAALFRDATGGGVLAHHNAVKMARARALLDTTEMAIADIGRATGFDDAFYFSRQFRRVHGVSPTAYREHRKG